MLDMVKGLTLTWVDVSAFNIKLVWLELQYDCMSFNPVAWAIPRPVVRQNITRIVLLICFPGINH